MNQDREGWISAIVKYRDTVLTDEKLKSFSDQHLFRLRIQLCGFPTEWEDTTLDGFVPDESVPEEDRPEEDVPPGLVYIPDPLDPDDFLDPAKPNLSREKWISLLVEFRNSIRDDRLKSFSDIYLEELNLKLFGPSTNGHEYLF